MGRTSSSEDAQSRLVCQFRRTSLCAAQVVCLAAHGAARLVAAVPVAHEDAKNVPARALQEPRRHGRVDAAGDTHRDAAAAHRESV